MRTLSVLGFVALIAGCNTVLPDGESVKLGRAFELSLGHEVRLDDADLTLRFIQVAEDSRCPTGASCVWEGNARAVLEAVHAGDERGIALNTSHDPRVGPRTAEVAGYRVELLDLAPAAETGDTIPQDRYRATLRVSETG